MKKIIYSTIVLITFSLSVMLFQISCEKEAIGNDDIISQQNKFLFIIHNEDASNNSDFYEFWIANIDGTNLKKIPIALPEGLKHNGLGSITPDGQTLIFNVSNSNKTIKFIYSISVDGSNLKMIFDGNGKTEGYKWIEHVQAY